MLQKLGHLCRPRRALSRAGGLIAVAMPWLLGPGLAIGAGSNGAVSKEEFLAEYGLAGERRRGGGCRHRNLGSPGFWPLIAVGLLCRMAER